MSKTISMSDLIAPSFYEAHTHLKRVTPLSANQVEYTHYWFGGGRGSTKSSFISVELIMLMLKCKEANVVVYRKVASTLRDSVYAQVKWAINSLGLNKEFAYTISPLCITKLDTGQKILFKGLDVAEKSKGLKFETGYCKYVWFEELVEFNGMEEVRSILQSTLRGGIKQKVFYSYNPPQSITNWVNQEVLVPEPTRYIHKSDYRTVPPEWLGEQFIIEAEALKKSHPTKYEHEYLGEVTGTGGQVFDNVKVQYINTATFDRNNYRRGIDFGFAVDPFAYCLLYYERKYKRLYIIQELYKTRLSNAKAVLAIKKIGELGIITADSAEPKSIEEMCSLGLNIHKAKKGPDSIDFGIKFLQDLDEIIIDPRCKNAIKEFTGYEYKRSRDGTWQSDYPDKDNHLIDAVRYAMEEDMKNKTYWFGL